MMVELLHSAVWSVEEKTYLRMLFILSAYGPVEAGHIAANSSYVRLPINIASVTRSCFSARSPASWLKYGSAQA